MLLSEQRQSHNEKRLDYLDLVDIDARFGLAEDRLAELAKARELSGNRLFQVGIAILTFHFAPIVTVIGALQTALLRK